MSKKLTEAQKARRAWVRALRSGKYKQTTHCLHDKSEKGKEGFCCLGVLCELALKEGVIEAARDQGSSYYAYGRHSNYLPEKVREWVGLTERSGAYGPPSTSNLAQDNDFGSDFNTIAATIESEPEGLFEGEI